MLEISVQAVASQNRKQMNGFVHAVQRMLEISVQAVVSQNRKQMNGLVHAVKRLLENSVQTVVSLDQGLQKNIAATNVDGNQKILQIHLNSVLSAGIHSIRMMSNREFSLYAEYNRI